jgi:hypothetical protein
VLTQFSSRFFNKINPCIPLLNERVFTAACKNNELPSALLCNVYATSILFWQQSPDLRQKRHIPHQFVWLKASRAVLDHFGYSPGTESIIAACLNVAGRPVTSMAGNAIRLGSVVSLAFSLGLNRDPSKWEISSREGYMRVRIWWIVLILDWW